MRIAKEWASMAPRFHQYLKHELPTMRSIGSFYSSAEFMGIPRSTLRKVMRYGTKPVISPVMFPNAKDPFTSNGFRLSFDAIMQFEKKAPGWQVANSRGHKFPRVGALVVCHIVAWACILDGGFYLFARDISHFQEQLYGKVVVNMEWDKYNFNSEFDATEKVA